MGVGTGISVAVLTFALGRRLERQRWERDDRIRREDLERQQAERWLDLRRDLLARLLAQVEDIRETGREVLDREPKAAEPAWSTAYNLSVEIALIEPTLEDACDRVYDSACDLVHAASRCLLEHMDDDVEPLSLDDREKPLNDAIDAFMVVASDRLGTAVGSARKSVVVHG